MFNILALNCCGLKNKLQYPEFQELLRANDIICLVESKTDDTDEILLPVFKLLNSKLVLSQLRILSFKHLLFKSPMSTLILVNVRMKV
jgi:hypothetical protein